MGDSEKLNLGEAANRFLGSLPPKKREASQREVNRFVRWYGRERGIDGLAAPEVANYAERLSLSDTDYLKKLEIVRVFLAYAKKEDWTRINLATHLKTKKAKSGALAGKQCLPESIPLTQEGYAELEAELAELKSKRPQLIEEIRRAAADKDFRENAPLAAAREQRGHLEGRIKELEETIKAATIINQTQKTTLKAGIGGCVVLCDLASGEELRYTIVNPKEVAPAQGKISSASPIGKALLNHVEGEVVEVTAPAGKLRYQIKRVER